MTCSCACVYLQHNTIIGQTCIAMIRNRHAVPSFYEIDDTGIILHCIYQLYRHQHHRAVLTPVPPVVTPVPPVAGVSTADTAVVTITSTTTSITSTTSHTTSHVSVFRGLCLHGCTGTVFTRVAHDLRHHLTSDTSSSTAGSSTHGAAAAAWCCCWCCCHLPTSDPAASGLYPPFPATASAMPATPAAQHASLSLLPSFPLHAGSSSAFSPWLVQTSVTGQQRPAAPPKRLPAVFKPVMPSFTTAATAPIQPDALAVLDIA
jgi:hypothetical protein